MDFEGNLKEIPVMSSKQYVIQFIVPTANYIVLKIDSDQNGDKRYYPLIHESTLNLAINSKFNNFFYLSKYFLIVVFILEILSNLNKGRSVERKPGVKKNNPNQSFKQGLSTPTSTSSSQSNLNTTRTKSKR